MGTEALALPVFEMSPPPEEGDAKNTKQTNQRKHSVAFHLRLPRAQEQKWVNDRKAFRLIQGKNDRSFKCDY